MRTCTLTVLALLQAAAVTSPLSAGDLHGTVTCKGVKNSADAVVYIEAIPGKTFAAPKEHAKIDQKNLVFVPHVLPVVVGTTVDFKNSDAVLHNVFSPDACCEKFNLGTWPQGQSKSQTFNTKCIATLLCKVHPEMEAFVLAVPTPYYAVTKADGSYTIPGVPDGAVTVNVWHPKCRATQKALTVKGATVADFGLSK